MGQSEEIRGISPDGESLQISALDGNIVTERHRAETQIAAILDPAVAKAGVAHRIQVAYTRNGCLLFLSGPSVHHSRRLVQEEASTFKQTALVVEHIITQRVVEHGRERQVLPIERGVDITIEVGIGVTDNRTVCLIYQPIAIHIREMDVTGLEIRTFAILLLQIQGCRLGFSHRTEDALGLVAVEHANRLSHLRQDGSTLDRGLYRAVCIRKGCHLILIVSGRSSQLPAEILQGQYFEAEADIEAHILELTLITPVLLESAGPGKLAQGEKVRRPTLEEVQSQVQAVAQEITCQASRQATGGLPLQVSVADVSDNLAADTFRKHTLCHEVGT